MTVGMVGAVVTGGDTSYLVAVTGGMFHTGNRGSSDRRDASYWKSWEQRQEGCVILEIVGAATGGMLHTGNRGSSDRRDASYWKSWEQRQEGCFILEIVGAATGGMLHTGNRGSSDRRDASYRRRELWMWWWTGHFVP